MNVYRAKPLSYPWPAFLYGTSILAAWALGQVAPIPVSGSHGWAPWLAGSATIAAAVTLDIWAMKTLLERCTTILPHRSTAHLVTCGPFRLTRNPIYLGFTLMMVGFGLIMLNPWFFVLAIANVILTTTFVVRHEELHLLSRFGFEFELYCRSTSRWI